MKQSMGFNPDCRSLLKTDGQTERALERKALYALIYELKTI